MKKNPIYLQQEKLLECFIQPSNENGGGETENFRESCSLLPHTFGKCRPGHACTQSKVIVLVRQPVWQSNKTENHLKQETLFLGKS